MNKRGRKPNPENAGLPKVLVCTVCSATFKNNISVFKKNIEKIGCTADEFVASYVCRKCKNVKQPKVKIQPVHNDVKPFEIIKGAVPSKQSDLSGDTCYYPSIFLNNFRACDGCTRYEMCQYDLKRLSSEPIPKRIKKDEESKEEIQTQLDKNVEGEE